MPRPSYKDDPLWKDAIELVTEAYSLAERAREKAPLVSRHLRRAAVNVPASIAETLTEDREEKRSESRLRTRGALAEIERQTQMLPEELAAEGEALAQRARGLYWRTGRAAKRKGVRSKE